MARLKGDWREIAEEKIILFVRDYPGSTGPEIAKGIGMERKLYSLHPIFRYLKDVGDMHSVGNTNAMKFYPGDKP